MAQKGCPENENGVCVKEMKNLKKEKSELKSLNEKAKYKKTKMKTVHTMFHLIRIDCHFAFIYVRDTYYSIPTLN